MHPVLALIGVLTAAAGVLFGLAGFVSRGIRLYCAAKTDTAPAAAQ